MLDRVSRTALYAKLRTALYAKLRTDCTRNCVRSVRETAYGLYAKLRTV
jgi:hypothetical protein